MKRFFSFLLFISAISAFGQDRNTVRDLMKFYYVERINDPAYTPVLLDNAAIMTGTETGGFWTNANMRGPQQLVRALLRAPGSGGGDANMQRIAAKILRVLNKPVKVNLLDDASTNVGQVAQRKYGACLGDNNKAWPCASNMTTSDDYAQNCARIRGVAAPPRSDNVWAGNVCMGTAYFGSSNYSSKFSTILHELVHTQDYTDGRGHLFWVNTHNYRYGADGSHFGTEAIPNRAMTYKEGIANAIRLMYDNNRLNEMFTWFSSNGNMLVERAIHPPGTSPSDSLHPCIIATAPSADVWLFNQLTSAGITPLANSSDGTYGMFRLRSLPARFIAHNEYILAMIGEVYSQHVSERKFFNAIQDVNSQLLRASGSGYALLFKSLCHQAIPAGRTFASLQTSSPASTPKPYLYPLALVDYFTGYRASSVNDFRDIFENQGYMNDWIDLYWNNAKNHVRSTVPLTTPRRENLTDIAIALGITSSIPD